MQHRRGFVYAVKKEPAIAYRLLERGLSILFIQHRFRAVFHHLFDFMTITVGTQQGGCQGEYHHNGHQDQYILGNAAVPCAGQCFLKQAHGVGHGHERIQLLEEGGAGLDGEGACAGG